MTKVFVTGGAGFLGRAILREARMHHPDWEFTIFSRDEGKQAPVRAEFPEHHYILGDVRNLDRLTLAIAGHDYAIHAAAFKYVPQAETHVAEAVSVNVLGSHNVLTAALRMRVERVIGISTDKACRAINVYGLTKRVMERMFQEADTLTETQFNCVRYGNVMGSTGSVIPLFIRQAKTGHITLTNPRMTRFWLSADYAVELIFRALKPRFLDGGVILIPRLAATDMQTVAHACSIVAEHDITADIVGHRHGEKVHEDLLAPEEVAFTRRPGDGKLMDLYPPTVGEVVDPPPGLYTSATPDHWLDAEQMADMIRKGVEL